MRYATLCVLSFNRPALLRQTVETIHEHADYPFELIVHDDGSNQETQDCVRDLLARGLVSTAILNPEGANQGQGIALNRMFRIAAGDPIIKVDHDLIFKPGWLRDAVTILEGNRRQVRRGGTTGCETLVYHDPEPRIGLLGLLHYWHEPVHTERTKIGEHKGWSEHSHILGSAFAMPRVAWKRFGPFEEHSPAFAEDAVMQRKVTAADGWACALPPEDLCENVGMGYGPSTVNVTEGVIQAIHQEPVIFGLQSEPAMPGEGRNA